MTYYEVYALEPNSDFGKAVEMLVRAGQEHQLIFDRHTIENLGIDESPVIAVVIDNRRYLVGNLESLKEHLKQ